MAKVDETQLLKWKFEYGAVHAVTIESQRIYYRSLNTMEYLAFMDLSTSLPTSDWAEAIFKTVVLHGPDAPLTLAGSYSTIAESATSNIGLSEEAYDALVEVSRTWASEHSEKAVTYAIAVKAAAVYPGIDLLQLLKMTPEHLFRTVAVLELATKQSILTETQELTSKPVTMDAESMAKRGITPEKLAETTNVLAEAIKHGRNGR